MKQYTILEALKEMQIVMDIDISKIVSISAKGLISPCIFIIQNTSGWKGEINLDDFTAKDIDGNIMQL